MVCMHTTRVHIHSRMVRLSIQSVLSLVFIHPACPERCCCCCLLRWDRMDDAEACFILSSRNEVDRMAAVSRTVMSSAQSSVIHNHLWAVMHVWTGGQVIHQIMLIEVKVSLFCVQIFKNEVRGFVRVLTVRTTRPSWEPGRSRTLPPTVLSTSRYSNRRISSMLSLQVSVSYRWNLPHWYLQACTPLLQYIQK